MPVKYHCARCGRRFVDWGAEKLGFKCPDCEDQVLVRLGASEDRPGKRTSLKRGARKALPVEPIETDDEEIYAGVDDPDEVVEVEDVSPDDVADDEEEAFVATDEEEGPGFARSPAELIPPDADEDEVTIDMPEDLNFGDVAPSLPDDTFDEGDENWHE